MSAELTSRRGARYRVLATLALTSLLPVTAAAQTPTAHGVIRGRVTDARGTQALGHARITVEGTSVVVESDASGQYTIDNVPVGTATVHVRLLGYKAATHSVAVTATSATTLNVALEQVARALDEIVVTGTVGQARLREVGNSIAEIDVAKIDQPAPNVDALLQSQSPSVSVTAPGASFGSGAAIRLRGSTSAALSNQPIIFVDGIRQSAEAYPLNASAANFENYGPGSRPTPLNDINPTDIERIEIVKGPAASTLYGSEASAGVIQIFTRKGLQGRPNWSFQSDYSLDWVKPFGSEARPYVNLDPWLKKASGTNNNLSVSGGLNDLRYFISGGYKAGDGVLPNDHENRASFRSNVDLSAHPTLQLQLNVAYTDDELDVTHTGNSGMALPFNAFRAPNNSFGSSDYAVLNELVQAKIGEANERLTYGLSARWNPIERLTQRFTVGVDRTSTIETQYRPLGFSLEPQGAISDIRWVSRTITTDYNGSLRWLDLKGFASTFGWGGQSAVTDQSTVDAYGRGFPGPGKQTMSSVAEHWVSGSESRVVAAGFFFQNMVGFRDRVFVTGAVRVDGNSAFGKNLGLLVYPKASASWVISDESFWPRHLGTLKLRGAYGKAGKAPGPFDAVRTWTANSFGGESAFLPGNVGNADLGPERTSEIEFGFDGSWLDDRIAADVSYYDQRTRDGLVSISEIPSNGFGGNARYNLGALRNDGVEIALHGVALQTSSMRWSVGTNISTNHSRITDLGAVNSNSTQLGQPVGVIRGTRILNADADSTPIAVQNYAFGPGLPTHIIGVNTTLELPKGIRISAGGEYQGGHYISDGASSAMIDRGNGAPACDAAYAIVPYTTDASWKTRDMTGIRALDRARCYRGSVSGAWVYPADFFKLRDLTIVFPVPTRTTRIRGASLTLSLRNAFRWTNRDFGAFDPEMIGSRNNTAALTPSITENAPAPARFATSLRLAF